MRLQLFILSPIFPILLGLIIFILYKILFGCVIYCDSNDVETLYELKLNLTGETAKYRSSVIYYEFFTDLHNQVTGRSVNQRNIDQEQTYISSAIELYTKMEESLMKIREIETSIRRIEPNFQSPIQPISYLRIGR